MAAPTQAARGSLAVIGAGWAGLAAAVHGVRAGHRVTLYEMAAQAGGRSREVLADGRSLDNGQHILIGAYRETLDLMRSLGVDAAQVLLRSPLRIAYPDGAGLQLRPGAAMPAFAVAVLRHPTWRWRDKLSLLSAATGWALRGFDCHATLSVASLTRGIGTTVRNELIDPLCVAALNTPSHEASAQVFLRVLHDALFSAPGSADLLLPRASLSALLPGPALAWLASAGATLRLGRRVVALAQAGAAWQVDGDTHDRVVLATPPLEAARLTRAFAPAWADTASAMRYEPIVTVYLHSAGTRLPLPMLALHQTERHPAQFVFDRGQLGGDEGLLAFVISGAAAWVERGLDATTQATLVQARATLGAHLRGPVTVRRTWAEKRATFRCTPGLQRAAMHIAPGLHAAGDHVAGPYSATLEGAVRSGRLAVLGFD